MLFLLRFRSKDGHPRMVRGESVLEKGVCYSNAQGRRYPSLPLTVLCNCNDTLGTHHERSLNGHQEQRSIVLLPLSTLDNTLVPRPESLSNHCALDQSTFHWPYCSAAQRNCKFSVKHTMDLVLCRGGAVACEGPKILEAFVTNSFVGQKRRSGGVMRTISIGGNGAWSRTLYLR
eukprot:379918-Amphidinium_carterae.1